MRLIDADALKEYFKTIRKYHVGKYCEWYLADVLEQQPTVDAVPVKHGKWIDETFKPWGLVHHPYKCNLCGDHAEFASPYCPNCGARMDEE